MVRNVADLYRLTVEDLLTLEGFARKSAGALYDAIQATKKPRLDRFLYALGIPLVGERTARLLARRYGNLAALRQATEEDLMQTPEIGPEIARSVAAFFREKENREVLAALEKTASRSDPSGITLRGYRSRGRPSFSPAPSSASGARRPRKGWKPWEGE